MEELITPDVATFTYQLLLGTAKVLYLDAIALGFVYILHRMLYTRKVPNSRLNLLAISVMLIWTIFTDYINGWEQKELAIRIYDTIELVVLACIPYVLFCWKLFARVDKWLDRKIGKA